MEIDLVDVQREQVPSGRRARIFLIHATRLSIEPTAASFARLWPEAELSNLMDDSLSVDLERAGTLTPSLIERFQTLSSYAARAGADGILFTCSAFGPAIEACRTNLSLPILKPNEAMIDEALARSGMIALLATFAPTLQSLEEEFFAHSAGASARSRLRTFFVPDAFLALQRGDIETHDQRIADTARKAGDCDVICFGQFSMSRAADRASRAAGRPVLTTPGSAVERLKCLVCNKPASGTSTPE